MFPLGAILDIGGKLIDRFFPDPEQKAKAQLELLQMQQNGQLAQIQAEIAGQEQVTKRWEADMASDSWLSKNIRPLTLIFILCAYFIFSMMSAFDYDTNEAYVKLLGEWGQLVMLAYFAGRTVEKVMDMKEKAKKDAS
jgi:hypothetical protein